MTTQSSFDLNKEYALSGGQMKFWETLKKSGLKLSDGRSAYSVLKDYAKRGLIGISTNILSWGRKDKY